MYVSEHYSLQSNLIIISKRIPAENFTQEFLFCTIRSFDEFYRIHSNSKYVQGGNSAYVTDPVKDDDNAVNMMAAHLLSSHKRPVEREGADERKGNYFIGKDFLVPPLYRPALGPTQPPVQWVK
jgi:hypothetical protein